MPLMRNDTLHFVRIYIASKTVIDAVSELRSPGYYRLQLCHIYLTPYIFA